jgi:hypothetical protein
MDIEIDDRHALQTMRFNRMRAATPMLLKKQKPIGLVRSAWWPGGRTAQKAFSHFTLHDQVDRMATGARSAQGSLPGVRIHGRIRVEVDDTQFDGEARLMRSRCDAGCTRSSCSKVASGASW